MATDVLHTEAVLEAKEKEFHGKDDHLGITLMVFPQYTSAVRLSMVTNHLKQYTVLNEGEVPNVFTNYENIFGKHSSALVLADSDYEVVHKVQKYEDYPDYLYALFVYDKKADKYDIIFKKISEDLTEKFGYKYNNESLDRLRVGDTISKGEVLYKSTSYDEDNNYCYGRNANVAYILDPGNVEDAYVISEDFAEKMVSRQVETPKIVLNDNDFLLNLYGDSKHYQPLPNLGEEVKSHVLCAKRRIINDQILFDMKKSNMMKIIPNSDTVYYAKGFMTDINIYSNKSVDELIEADYNEQIIYYLKNQNRFYQELLDECEKIKASGSKYSDDIGFVLARAKRILDPNYLWKDNENVFSNLVIEIQVDRDVKLFAGSKITGRYGDKGVISEIRPTSEMPYTKDGRVVDVIVNPLSCPNRLNPFQWIELSLTHDAALLINELKTKKTNAERWKMLKQFMRYFNERGEADELEKYYTKLAKADQNTFWEDIYEHGIYINYPPMWEDQPALDKIAKLKNDFGFQRDQLYIRKYGREIPIMRNIVVGTKYMLKLKQTSEKNFSARSTGSLSQQGIPEKSNKVRAHEKLYSSTPITLGRDENNNLAIGVNTFMLAKMHLVYRTSPFARREVGKLYTNNILDFKRFKIKPGFKNRNVEILNAKLKGLGLKIDFGFDGLNIEVDDGTLHEFSFGGETYICTRTEMRDILLDFLLKPNFEKLNLKGSKKELKKLYGEYKDYCIAKAKNYYIINTEQRPWED